MSGRWFAVTVGTAARRTLLATKLVEVTTGGPVVAPALEGVTVVEHTETILRLVVDTSRRAVRDLVDVVLDSYDVLDLSVVDPPLEQVIAEIYAEPRG